MSPGMGRECQKSTQQEKTLKPKLAKQLGNVSQACQIMGYSRDTRVLVGSNNSLNEFQCFFFNLRNCRKFDSGTAPNERLEPSTQSTVKSEG